MKLIRYLEMVGQITGEKLLEKMGEGWDTTELFEMIDRGLVSSGFGAHGTRYFRYPAWDGSRVDEALEYITKNPGSSGTQVQKALGWSREKLNRRLEELVNSGEIDRVKSGVSWLYSVESLPKPATKPAVEPHVIQSTPLAQPVESVSIIPTSDFSPDYSKTGKQVLTALGQETLTVDELLVKLPGSNREALEAKLQRLIKGKQIDCDESEEPARFFLV